MALFLFILILFSVFIFNSAYNISEEKIVLLDDMIEKQMKSAKLNTLGLIITNKSSTIYQKIYSDNEKVNENTPFTIGSVSKSFTTLGLLKLNVDLNKTIDSYTNLKEYINNEDAKNITIGELLNHTSGLENFGPKVNKDIKGKYSYSNYGFALLGKIIEVESKKTYNDYMKEAIFNPLNMTNANTIYTKDIIDSYDNFFGINTKYTGLESEMGDGFFAPSGFISASIEDMGKYLRYYLNEDSDDYRNYISQMLKRSVYCEYNIYYGMGMFVQKKNERLLYCHSGHTNSFSSYLYLYPEQELGIFVITNSNNFFCRIPADEVFKNIESFIAFDTMDLIHSELFFHVHFSLDIIYIIVIAIPLVYLIITIVRKFKKIKYSWFVGCKGIAIFIIEFILLIALPVALITIVYTVDKEIKIFVDGSKDLKFVLFTFSSALILTFIIKIVYIILFNKHFKSIENNASKRIEAADLNYMGI